jgi:hypothetical protein
MREEVKLVGKWILSHWRTLVLILVAIYLGDKFKYLDAFTLPITWVFLGAGLTLFIRKILFAGIDLVAYAKSAFHERNIAAAIIFAAIVYLMGVLLVSATEIMKAPFLSGGH